MLGSQEITFYRLKWCPQTQGGVLLGSKTKILSIIIRTLPYTSTTIHLNLRGQLQSSSHIYFRMSHAPYSHLLQVAGLYYPQTPKNWKSFASSPLSLEKKSHGIYLEPPWKRILQVAHPMGGLNLPRPREEELLQPPLPPPPPFLSPELNNAMLSYLTRGLEGGRSGLRQDWRHVPSVYCREAWEKAEFPLLDYFPGGG